MLIILMLYAFSMSQFMNLILNIGNSDEFIETLYVYATDYVHVVLQSY